MYNLKQFNGTFKGIIGECLFKFTKKDVIIPKFFNKNKYSLIFGRYFNEAQIRFLIDNWYSIDAIEILFERGRNKIILYEVKTNNYERIEKGFRTKITQSTVDIYNKAKKLGFDVKTAYVLLLDNWNYGVEINEFKAEDFCVDRPKVYDKH
ncbi:hypothetical protein J4434_01295 [Candidatus Woesearchaeota archaeon]|nr:hypothetical protein [Candidatus Woesearchaeota archaeon]